MEIEFSFAKQSAVVCGPTPINKTKDSSSSSNSSLENGKQTQLTSSPIEFSVVPPVTMKVPTNGSVILNIQAKLKNSYQLQTLKDAKAQAALPIPIVRKPEKYNHLLIAKIKDTQVVFSFIIEATVIEANGPANAMS